MSETLIGAHVSISGGVMNVFDNARAIGANFVQIFTRSPRVWRSPVISSDDAARFKAELETNRSGLEGLVTHASYLINLASADPEIFEKSRTTLRENVQIASALGARGVVLHIGSHKGAGLDQAMARLTSSLSLALEVGEGACRIFLENTAGRGGNVGVTFEELARVVEAMNGDERLGVCLDTQHLFASGVSFDTIEKADSVIERLSSTLGIERLGCIHLNDSKVPLGSRADRHENLGKGMIGIEALANLISNPRILGIPLILETPGSGEGPRGKDVDTAREILRFGVERRRSRAS